MVAKRHTRVPFEPTSGGPLAREVIGTWHLFDIGIVEFVPQIDIDMIVGICFVLVDPWTFGRSQMVSRMLTRRNNDLPCRNQHQQVKALHHACVSRKDAGWCRRCFESDSEQSPFASHPSIAFFERKKKTHARTLFANSSRRPTYIFFSRSFFFETFFSSVHRQNAIVAIRHESSSFTIELYQTLAAVRCSLLATGVTVVDLLAAAS